jgi:site-specific recombinase XerD
MTSPTLLSACEAFLSNVKKSRPYNTHKNYRSDLLGQSGLIAALAPAIKPTSPISTLDEELCTKFIQSLLDGGASPSTRQRKASVLRGFIGFSADAYDLPINIDKMNYKIKSRYLLSGVKDITEYPGDKIQKILDWSKTMNPINLQDRRDLAFLWLITETGMRVGEASSLKIGQIESDWSITFIQKGGDQATVNAPSRTQAYITAYLRSRKTLDASVGSSRLNLPLFARHDQAAGKGKVKKINTKTGEGIIHRFALLALGEDYDPRITCHKFRHYFITKIYERKGDLKETQELARHKTIATTQRYTHRNSMKNKNVVKEVFG